MNSVNDYYNGGRLNREASPRHTINGHHQGLPPPNGILKHRAMARDQGQVSQDEVEYYTEKLISLEGAAAAAAAARSSSPEGNVRSAEEVTALLTNTCLSDKVASPPPDPTTTSSSHSGHLSNNSKKETITYSQWKARVKRQTIYDLFFEPPTNPFI